ncbi:MAG TPA: prolyl oligopeptidase family serine peptidase, partial [Chloroflexota bacterium]|nr:prolyl oligopeptidase family serine peptidase [Chloroflexota bacterium]
MLIAPQLSHDAIWKQRFRAERRFATLASHDPDRGLVASNRSGRFQLYAWDVPTGRLSQITDRPAGTIFGQIAPNGEWIYFLDDTEGDEIGHYVRFPWSGGAPQDLTPTLPPHAMGSIGASASGSRLGLTVPGPAGFDFYVLNQEHGGSVDEPRLLHRSATLATGPVFSHDGETAVWAVAREGKLALGLLAFDPETGEKIAELWEGEDGSIEPGSFSPRSGDSRMLATTDRSGAARPLLWNPRSGRRIDLSLDELEGDIQAWAWSPDAAQILVCQIRRAAQRLWLYNVAGGELRPLAHPEGTFSRASFLANGDIAVQWQDSTQADQVIVLDAQTGEQKAVVLPAASVPPGRPWQSVTFPSADGTEIQAWVATPEDKGPHPTILHTHGGPTAVQLNVFMPDGQAWLDHGFAFCSVNYRGSTTFGRDFERKIWGNLGHWEVEDMV